MRRSSIAVVTTLLLVVACQPSERRPGQWLAGEVVTTPVDDWSFTKDVPLIFVETATWYGIPHSVTTTVVTHGGTLYVPSIYQDGGEFPTERFWNRNIARNADVRLGIAEKVYERRATLVADAGERANVLREFAAKYPRWAEMLKDGEPERPKLILLRLDPRRQT